MDTMLMPKFQLSLLDRLALSGPNGRIDLTSKKLAALLAYLACTAPQTHGRDKLMTLMWGSHSDAQARRNLRQVLTRLRQVLGDDALVTAGNSVSLRAGVIASDVTRLRRCFPTAVRMPSAVDLHRSSLLAEMTIPQEPWTEWAASQRQRLEALALDAMVRLG